MSSNINADGIDPNFPVAGVNNSTQGFRDNFFNIKNNLNYAKSEISDLQSKAILKSALNGQKLSNDFSETVIANATLKSIGTMINDLGATSGTAILDFKSSTHYFLSTTGSVLLTFKNWPTAGICGAIRLTISITDIAHTLTIPGTVSRGLYNIAGLTSSTANGLFIKPPTTISALPVAPATTYTVSATQTVGNASNPVAFTATSAAGAVATFSGYIVGVTLTVTSAVTGTIAAGMTLADSGRLGPGVISFAGPGDYVFDFETIDNGTSILIMDQSRASNVENVSYTPSTLRPATAGVLGGIKIGAGLSVTADGTASVKIATALIPGMVKIGTGLAIAADGTLSATASSSSNTGDSSSTAAPTNNSLVFGRLTVYKPNYGNIWPAAGGIKYPDETDWTNYGVSIRVPANGAYRFRVLGTLYYYISAKGSPVAGMLRIYVNGVNSSAADITFTVPNLAVVNSGNTDVFRDITGLKRGDKIELYYKWATNPPNNSTVGNAGFQVLIAGENYPGTHALSDYSFSTINGEIISPTTVISYIDVDTTTPTPPSPPVTGI
jgi:LysM repeat protein